METFSALLAICAGNSPVPGEFPAQRPVTRSFDIFFDLRLNNRLSKQSWGWWFEKLSRPLWRHCNAVRGTHVMWSCFPFCPRQILLLDSSISGHYAMTTSAPISRCHPSGQRRIVYVTNISQPCLTEPIKFRCMHLSRNTSDFEADWHIYALINLAIIGSDNGLVPF